MKDLWQNAVKTPGYQNYLAETQKKLGAFLSLAPRETLETRKQGPFSGIPVAVKDNIAVSGQPLTCGSKMLENVTSPYDATVVERLREAGAVFVGKTNLDEFGMGSSNQDSALGKTYNPWNKDSVPGGSSGGSAVAVASGMVPLAIGTDTGGAGRQPAMFCGVYGYKPTYGLLSRYGLTAYASSLETPGFIAREISWLEKAVEVTAGFDIHDQTTTSDTLFPVKQISKIGVLSVDDGLSPEMKEAYIEAQDRWKKLGMELKDINLPALENAVPSYYTIATAEASANLARFNGIRYGLRPEYAENPEELIRKSRTAGFGDEVKIRILLGTYVLRSGFQDQFYHRAQKIRTLIRQDLDRVFGNFDAILMPVFPTQAFLRGEAGLTHLQQKLADKFTVGANLAGYPALSLPSGLKNGLPVGFQLMVPALRDNDLFQLAKIWAAGLDVPEPPEYPAKWEA